MLDCNGARWFGLKLFGTYSQNLFIVPEANSGTCREIIKGKKHIWACIEYFSKTQSAPIMLGLKLLGWKVLLPGRVKRAIPRFKYCHFWGVRQNISAIWEFMVIRKRCKRFGAEVCFCKGSRRPVLGKWQRQDTCNRMNQERFAPVALSYTIEGDRVKSAWLKVSNIYGSQTARNGEIPHDVWNLWLLHLHDKVLKGPVSCRPVELETIPLNLWDGKIPQLRSLL